MTGRRSERTYAVYAVHAGSERWAFVPHPEIAGWWFRCHPSVLVARCDYPGCGAERGQPCKNSNGYRSQTHATRRSDARQGVGRLQYAHGIVMNIERPRRRILPDG